MVIVVHLYAIIIATIVYLFSCLCANTCVFDFGPGLSKRLALAVAVFVTLVGWFWYMLWSLRENED